MDRLEDLDYFLRQRLRAEEPLRTIRAIHLGHITLADLEEFGQPLGRKAVAEHTWAIVPLKVVRRSFNKIIVLL